ncbi:MAG: DUF4276 family protein [Turicibacter sp.]|nr:DUF4276 family protein [Turicibacter sp.]
MYVELLIEDMSGKKAMEILAPKLFNIPVRITAYKGIGHLPKNMKPKTDASKRQLLNQLPKLLQGFGKVPDCKAVVVICDLDDRDRQAFLAELNSKLEECFPKPTSIFCLAIEEFEAWYLGDLNAVRKAYPRAKINVLNGYKNDSICGTWETLADAVYTGGSKALKNKGWQAVGEQKFIWAEKISPHMNVHENISPSFNEMRNKLHGINSGEI